MTRMALKGRRFGRAERARRTYAGRAAVPFYRMAELRLDRSFARSVASLGPWAGLSFQIGGKRSGNRSADAAIAGRPGFPPESAENPEAFVKKDETKPYKNVTFVLDGRRDLCYHVYLSPQE
ncbi:hypothetical protein GCWU000341_02537 [Oribacterium sp. oral taxon 078 str. F0262]|nr:hypothetical protein GCWU000341_02537 [Oribacterium sp. oral taxon 078 str. F0262]